MQKVIMSSVKRRMCELDAASISWYRQNPCIAAKDLLGIELLDYQKYMLQGAWNASHVCWVLSRNGGKSFLAAVLLLLKAMLYENQSIYIVSGTGQQSKQTFEKIEQLTLRTGKTAASFKSLKDIAEKETVKSPTNRTGFTHSPEGYEVHFYNGSAIYTLNSNPDNNRSRRATLVFFDEASYCSDELIVICEAFATQSTDFITSTDNDYDPALEPPQCPTQLVYASSQGAVDALFYKHYKQFAKEMMKGNRDYFVCDFDCNVAINTYLNGRKYIPLLTQDKVDAALKDNKDKALREYYNQPQTDSGANSIVRWATIRRNETFYLPKLCWEPGYKYAIALDPARTNDNSIVTVMALYEDESLGWIGEICNCINLVDTASKKHYKLDSNRQVSELRNVIQAYSGNTAADYEYISAVLIDAGAGGGGVSAYADALLNDWTDKAGVTHHGLIDKDNDIYSTADYEELYPDAIDKLSLVSPRKYRTQMVEEFIELMNMGLIKFPYDNGWKEVISIVSGVDKNGEEVMEEHYLSEEELLSLSQIDLMKQEMTSIQKTQNQEKTSVQYALSKDKATSMHDDRWYTLILLAHHLYQLRKGAAISSRKKENEYIYGASMCVSTIAF